MEDNPNNPYQPPGSDVEGPTPPVAGNARPPLPWEDRDNVGFFPALWQTMVLFLTNPVEAYARARQSGDVASPLIYGIILGWIGAVVGQLWSLVLPFSFLPFAGEDALPMLGGAGFVAVLVIVFAPILIAIGLFISTCIYHVSVLVVGGRSTPGTFESTLRALAYAYSTQPLAFVPIVGGILAWIWALVLNVFGLSRMHGMSIGRAVLAVLLPIAVCCILVILVISLTAGMAFLSSQS